MQIEFKLESRLSLSWKEESVLLARTLPATPRS